MTNNRELTCGQCKNIYEKLQVKKTASGVNFCCRACYLESRREERKCLECQQSFKIKKSSAAKLCSKACAGIYNGKRQRKFTVKQIEVVKKKFSEGYTRRQLAAVYDVSPWTITRIINGRTEGR